MKLLEVNNISKSYERRRRFGRGTTPNLILQDVSFSINEGSCVGLMGESGAGKSTLARILVGLEQPDSGEVWFQGLNICHMNRANWKEVRRHIQFVYQNGYSSFNPRICVGDSIGEPLKNFERKMTSIARREQVIKLLVTVGLNSSDYHKMPHQFSGGQIQRVAIARALALQPKLLILDEVVSSLDSIIRQHILHTLKALKEELKLSYLFISHQKSAVDVLADRIIHLKGGRVEPEQP